MSWSIMHVANRTEAFYHSTHFKGCTFGSKQIHCWLYIYCEDPTCDAAENQCRDFSSTTKLPHIPEKSADFRWRRVFQFDLPGHKQR